MCSDNLVKSDLRPETWTMSTDDDSLAGIERALDSPVTVAMVRLISLIALNNYKVGNGNKTPKQQCQ